MENTLFQLSPEIFEQPLVQALLKDGGEDVDMDAAGEEKKSEPWMSPEQAVIMLEGTNEK
jgi:hypothetical protein